MKNELRSNTTTQGRRMAGARSLWRANGMKDNQMGKPLIAVVNSFTQFVPGHVHLHEIGQMVKQLIEKEGCFAAEFNTIAIRAPTKVEFTIHQVVSRFQSRNPG